MTHQTAQADLLPQDFKIALNEIGNGLLISSSTDCSEQTWISSISMHAIRTALTRCAAQPAPPSNPAYAELKLVHEWGFLNENNAFIKAATEADAVKHTKSTGLPLVKLVKIVNQSEAARAHLAAQKELDHTQSVRGADQPRLLGQNDSHENGLRDSLERQQNIEAQSLPDGVISAEEFARDIWNICHDSENNVWRESKFIPLLKQRDQQLLASRAGDGWQDISTAPEEHGRQFLTYSQDVGFVICERFGSEIVLSWNQNLYTQAKFWINLPPSPDTKQTAGK